MRAKGWDGRFDVPAKENRILFLVMSCLDFPLYFKLHTMRLRLYVTMLIVKIRYGMIIWP
jgi:hypothetical protein